MAELAGGADNNSPAPEIDRIFPRIFIFYLPAISHSVYATAPKEKPPADVIH
jgi:hypothetical protein